MGTNNIQRRTLLVTAVGGALAGCLGDDDEGSILTGIVVSNRLAEAIVVDVAVEWEGDGVLEETYEVDGQEPDGPIPGAAVDRTWPHEPGQFSISYRYPGDEWQSFEPGDHDYPDCMEVDISPSVNTRELGVSFVQGEDFCPEDDE